MTIESAVKQVIDDLPVGNTFSGLWLTGKVRVLREDMTMDGSCSRLLRQLAESGKISYEVLDRKKSLYRKLPVIPEPIYKTEENGQMVMR